MTIYLVDLAPGLLAFTSDHSVFRPDCFQIMDVYWLSLLTLAAILGAAVFARSNRTRSPLTIPWVGLRDELFSKARAHLRDESSALENLRQGYEKVSGRYSRQLFDSLNMILV